MSEFKFGLAGCNGALEMASPTQMLPVAEFIDSLGFEAMWLNEEHFQEGTLVGRPGGDTHCLSPIPTASAILARTTRLRVGFSVLLLALHHPIRLAEELATLDVLSGGRVDFGISRGGSPKYAVPLQMTEEAGRSDVSKDLDFLLEAWSDRKIDAGGKIVSVVPKPVQKPHPPVYIATYTPATAAWAGRAGHSLICHAIISLDAQQPLIDAYVGEGGDPARIPFGRFVYVSDTDENARREVWPTVLKLTSRLNSIRQSRAYSVIDPNMLEPEIFMEQMVIWGSPETCAEKIAAISDRFGIRYLNALAGFFGNLPFGNLLRSLQLMATEVRPLLNR